MPSATVTSKGQITIPVKVRRALGLDAGDKIDFFEIEGGYFAFKPRTGSIREMAGCIPKLDRMPTLEEMDLAVLDAVTENYFTGLREPVPSKDEAA